MNQCIGVPYDQVRQSPGGLRPLSLSFFAHDADLDTASRDLDRLSGRGDEIEHFIEMGAALVAATAKRVEGHDVPGVTPILALPDGMHWRDGVLDVDPVRYQILGRVRADMYDDLGLTLYPYREGERWRVGYCVWQIPLSWATLTLWSIFSPVYWPCKAAITSSVHAEDRREIGLDRQGDIVAALRRATRALGGDLVVVVIINDYHLGKFTSDCPPNDVSKCTEWPSMGGYGFAVRTAHE